MRVRDCKSCKYYQRRTRTTYKPSNYHPIVVKHAYAYCVKNKCYCSTVERCIEAKKEESK